MTSTDPRRSRPSCRVSPRRSARWLRALAAATLCIALDAQAARLALVVGNDNYLAVTKLRNARNDANAIARELEAAGFAVTRALDASRESMNDALDGFLRRIEKGDEVVFFFSGHGSQPPQLGPFLLPVDIKVTGARVIERDGMSLERLVDDLNQRARFSLLIIDACRDDPFRETTAGRSLPPGSSLGRVEPPKGTMVIMAASKGQQALDRLSNNDPVQNGLFTRELIKHMRTKGLSAAEMLRRVRGSVESAAAAVNHAQRPSLVDESSSDFFFYSGPGQTVSAPAAPALAPPAASPAPQAAFTPPPGPAPSPAIVPAPAPSPRPQTATVPPPAASPTVAEAQREFDAWEMALRANNRGAFDGFLRQYPTGRYADRARARVAELGAAPAAAPASAAGARPAAAAAYNPQAEFDLWDRAQTSNKKADYENYLRQYPNGRYADRARAALPKAN